MLLPFVFLHEFSFLFATLILALEPRPRLGNLSTFLPARKQKGTRKQLSANVAPTIFDENSFSFFCRRHVTWQNVK